MLKEKQQKAVGDAMIELVSSQTLSRPIVGSDPVGDIVSKLHARLPLVDRVLMAAILSLEVGDTTNKNASRSAMAGELADHGRTSFAGLPSLQA